MKFVDDIADFFMELAIDFEDIYLTIEGWAIAPSWLAEPFLWAAYRLLDISSSFTYLSLWLDDLAANVGGVLDFGAIYNHFEAWFDAADDAWYWIKNAFTNVTNIIDDWWTNTLFVVQGLIALAVEGLDTLIVAWDSFSRITFPQWTNSLILLASEWGNFVTQKLPTLFDISYAETWWTGKLLDIAGLVASAFTERESWWAGWQDFRDIVAEFFSDPLEFLWERFTDWFLGPEG